MLSLAGHRHAPKYPRRTGLLCVVALLLTRGAFPSRLIAEDVEPDSDGVLWRPQEEGTEGEPRSTATLMQTAAALVHKVQRASATGAVGSWDRVAPEPISNTPELTRRHEGVATQPGAAERSNATVAAGDAGAPQLVDLSASVQSEHSDDALLPAHVPAAAWDLVTAETHTAAGPAPVSPAWEPAAVDRGGAAPGQPSESSAGHGSANADGAGLLEAQASLDSLGFTDLTNASSPDGARAAAPLLEPWDVPWPPGTGYSAAAKQDGAHLRPQRQ